MRIHVQQPERPADLPRQGAQQRQGDAVLAAECDQVPARGGLAFDQGEAGGEVAERDLELAEIGDVHLPRIDPVQRVAAIDQHAAGAPDGGWPVAAAGAVGGAEVERHAGDAEGRTPVLPRDAEEARRRGEGRVVRLHGST